MLFRQIIYDWNACFLRIYTVGYEKQEQRIAGTNVQQFALCAGSQRLNGCAVHFTQLSRDEKNRDIWNDANTDGDPRYRLEPVAFLCQVTRAALVRSRVVK